jgi:anti-sigma-K factor RskA
MSDHEKYEPSLAAWVLGAVDSEEAADIAAHVDGCAECRETARRLGWVASMLPLEVEEREPTARLRSRILNLTSSPPRPSPGRMDSRPPDEGNRRRRLKLSIFDRVPTVAAAAVVLLALTLGVVVGEVAARSTAVPPQTEVSRFTLSGHGSMAGAQATVVDLKHDGIALVDFSGLPPLEPGNVYELWLIRSDQQPHPAGVFVPDSNGTKMVVVATPLAGYMTMAVTTEQGPNGVQAPTQQPQLYGSVA